MGNQKPPSIRTNMNGSISLRSPRRRPFPESSFQSTTKSTTNERVLDKKTRSPFFSRKRRRPLNDDARDVPSEVAPACYVTIGKDRHLFGNPLNEQTVVSSRSLIEDETDEGRTRRLDGEEGASLSPRENLPSFEDESDNGWENPEETEVMESLQDLKEELNAHCPMEDDVMKDDLLKRCEHRMEENVGVLIGLQDLNGQTSLRSLLLTNELEKRTDEKKDARIVSKEYGTNELVNNGANTQTPGSEASSSYYLFSSSSSSNSPVTPLVTPRPMHLFSFSTPEELKESASISNTGQILDPSAAPLAVVGKSSPDIFCASKHTEEQNLKVTAESNVKVSPVKQESGLTLFAGTVESELTKTDNATSRTATPICGLQFLDTHSSSGGEANDSAYYGSENDSFDGSRNESNEDSGENSVGDEENDSLINFTKNDVKAVSQLSTSGTNPLLTECEESPVRQPDTRGKPSINETPTPPDAASPAIKGNRKETVPNISWAENRALRQGAEVNAVQGVLLELLRNIRRKCDPFAFFSRPVDPVRDECRDYFEIIRESDAMDMGTMEILVRDGTLYDIRDFESNLDRIVRCARRYNVDETNFVRERAEKLNRLSAPLIERARRKLERMHQMATCGGGKKWFEETEGKPEELDLDRHGDNRSDSSDGDNEESPGDEDHDFDKSPGDEEHDFEESPGDEEHESRSYAKFIPPRGSSHNLRRSPKRSAIVKEEDEAKDTIVCVRQSPRSRKFVVANVTEVSKRNRRKSNAQEGNDSSDDESIPGSDIPFCTKDLSLSTLMRCSSRSDWLDLCPQMVIVCNEAARRSTLRANPDANHFDKPLSETFMKERLELDNPLRGFIVKSSNSTKDHDDDSHLQGFVIYTNFTTWRSTFRWTMDTPAAGITPTDHQEHACDDGSFTMGLQRVKGTNDSSQNKIIYNQVAEISLLGGLGCGGPLLERALCELNESNQYKYVVLQSTKIAIRFYERYGFVRIGAVARFNDDLNMSEVAYRHWGDVSDREIEDASYMMALRLPYITDCSDATKKDDTPEKPISVKLDTPESILSKRHNEIKSALSSFKYLVQDALQFKITSRIGCQGTYRELISTARLFCLSAGDEKLVALIDHALKESTGHSKTMLRKSLRFLKDKSFSSRAAKLNLHSEDMEHCETSVLRKSLGFLKDESISSRAAELNLDSEDVEDCETSEPLSVRHQTLRINRIVVDGEPFLDSDPETNCTSKTLDACISDKLGIFHKKDWKRSEVAVTISVRGERTAPPESSDTSFPLSACLSMPERFNADEARESTRVACDFLRKSIDIYQEKIEPEKVNVGDWISIKVKDYNGLPLWRTSYVHRMCSKAEAHLKRFSSKNAFMVELPEGDFQAHNLDPVSPKMTRGVGRKWCPISDWLSFIALPADILDLFFIGSRVKYPDEYGNKVDGRISKRIGGGLDSEPKWRVVFNLSNCDDSYYGQEYSDLDVCAIREAVIVDDDTMEHIIEVVGGMDNTFEKKNVSRALNSVLIHSKPEKEQAVNKQENSLDTICLESKSGNDEWALKRMQDEHLGNWAKTNRRKRKEISPQTNAILNEDVCREQIDRCCSRTRKKNIRSWEGRWI